MRNFMKKYKAIILVGNTAWDNKRSYLEPATSVPILTALLKEEFDLFLIDANGREMSKEDTFKSLQEIQADIVLITALSVEWYKCYHEAARLSKEALPKAKVLMGGVYPTVSGDFVLKDPNIDYIMLGHAEERINRVVKLILENDSKIFFEAGVGYRKNNKIIINPVKTFIGDIPSNRMVKPDYSLQDLNLYLSEYKPENAIVKRETSIISSYGCPYNCVFCATRTISGRKIAFRPVDDIMDEIKYLIDNYNIDSIKFLDDNILSDKQRAKDLFNKMIQNNYVLKFQLMNTAAWLLDEELLDLMKEAGCYALTISLESGNDRVLKDIIHKPLRKEIVPSVIKMCNQRNIFVSMNIVIGLPGETWNEILDTIKYSEICNPDFLQINIATVFPKTELYDIAFKNGYLEKNFSFYSDKTYYGFAKGQITTKEFTPQELMIIRAYEWDRINFTDPVKRKRFCNFRGITEKQLETIRREARRNIGLTYTTHRKDIEQ